MVRRIASETSATTSSVAARLGSTLAPSVGAPSAVRFPTPTEVVAPVGAEGWADLYGYSLPFGEDRRDYEESVFWFRETIHWPKPLRPFEAGFLQEALTALGQFNHRHYRVPTARGLDFRLLNGYCYLSPGAIEDPEQVIERSVAFEERAGFYYEHWDELYLDWKVRIADLLSRLESVVVPSLPELMPVEEIISGRGLGRAYDLPRAYRLLLDLGSELWQYHFEFLNLGYAAYLDYFAFCRSMSPDISDLQVARMVAGIDVDLFRPDQELCRLARAAVELGVADELCAGTWAEARESLASSSAGAVWLAELQVSAHPWFNYSTGSGFYFDDIVWADRMEVPVGFIRSYVGQLRAGHEIDAPAHAIAEERDRLAGEVRARLRGADLRRFDEKLRLARTVVHFVENHNFYIEHWGMSVLWRQLRKVSSVFVAQGFWAEPDDMFYLRSDEVDTAMRDMLAAWATGTPARGPVHWPQEVPRRKAIIEACAASTPPPALGVPPLSVTEPFTIMLWGITSEGLRGWLAESNASSASVLTGFGASPGIVVGRARVVVSRDELDDLQDDEILVAELTSPSWAPVFGRIAGTVTESGGMMCHVAIVCREYGLPAVTGVSGAVRSIRTGQMLRIDGSAGTVTILEN
ncbi:MAG: PEP-utilizing enzyme [Ilumatobacteraceae bacterium]